MIVTRRMWQNAISSPRYRGPNGLQSFLLVLSLRCVDADGLLDWDRKSLVEATGRSRATVTRYLGDAVELGWLVRLRSGDRGGHAVYAAWIPWRKRPVPEPQVSVQTGQESGSLVSTIPAVNAAHSCDANERENAAHLLSRSIKTTGAARYDVVDVWPEEQPDRDGTGIFVRISDRTRMQLALWSGSRGQPSEEGRTTDPVRLSSVIAGLDLGFDLEPVSYVSGGPR